MRLRRNQLCPIHRSLACCGRGPVFKGKPARQMGVRRIDDPQHPRGYREIRSNAEMRKVMDRKIAAQTAFALSARGSSRITATSFRTISIPVGWEERGGTIIPTTSRQSTGGATEKRAQAGRDGHCSIRQSFGTRLRLWPLFEGQTKTPVETAGQTRCRLDARIESCRK